MGFFQGTQERVRAVVKELSVFESLKFNCIGKTVNRTTNSFIQSEKLNGDHFIMFCMCTLTFLFVCYRIPNNAVTINKLLGGIRKIYILWAFTCKIGEKKLWRIFQVFAKFKWSSFVAFLIKTFFLTNYTF